MDFQDEDIKEFILEATELLDIAEQSLLDMDSGNSFGKHYDAIFRSFHSIKGASGMMSLTTLQAHMHQLENTFTQFKSKTKMEKFQVDFFLRGVDAARQLLEGKTISFNYSMEEAKTAPAPSPKVAPAPTMAPAATTPTSSTVPKVQATLNKKTICTEFSHAIMVIDDEPDIGEILSDILKGHGFNVLVYSDPEKAVQDFAKVRPYVVLSDFSMPKLSGIQVLEKLNAFDPDVPLIFVSGYITKEVLLDSLSLGVFGVVEKPFEDKRILQLAVAAYKRCEIQKLLDRSIKLITYQFSDLDDYLKKQGKDEVRKLVSSELNQLLTQKRNLKASHKKAA